MLFKHFMYLLKLFFNYLLFWEIKFSLFKLNLAEKEKGEEEEMLQGYAEGKSLS